MTEETDRTRRTVHLSDEAWEVARVEALKAAARAEEAISRSAWIEMVILQAANKGGAS